MKKFIFEIVIMSCMVLVTSICFYCLSRPELVDKISEIKASLDIVNLGTSHGDDFDYSGLKLNGLAFNNTANTLYYDLQNFRFLKQYLSDSAIIILPISYFSFGLDENRTDLGVDNPFVNDFYQYLPKTAIYNYSQTKSNNLMVHRIQQNFRSLFSREEYNQVKRNVGSLAYQVKLRVVHHKKIGTYANPYKNVIYLETLIDEIIKGGFKPILITTPYFRDYNNGIGDVWLNNNYYKYLNLVIKKYNITYLDYGSDPRLSPFTELFMDADHLNQAGIDRFTHILFEDFVQLKYLPSDAIKKK